ncbi:hypothetical protein GO491_02360 [Flavobacteriaceae bacterium Ap0902]|nr:hypothetical protein [Flavobacteriaceae bacterium Ap0902]
MRKLLTLALSASAIFGAGQLNAQANCDALEIQLNKHINAKNYDAAYPLLNQALMNCAAEKINFYNFGETILIEKLESSKDTAKYGNELITLIDKRLQNFPSEKKNFWKGEQINYKLKYKLVDQKTAYDEYKTLFGDSNDVDAEKVSANTVLTYYSTALELMNQGVIDFEEALEVYFQTKKVAEDNIELRSIEYGRLAEKLDSIKSVNPKKDLTAAEKTRMSNAQTSKDIFIQVNESMEAVLSEYTTCDNIAPMFINAYDENKDSIEWLAGAYQALASKECFDQPIMEQLETRYAALWREQNPQAEATQVANKSGGVIGTSYGAGAAKFKAGNYSGAIADFKKAIDEVSGTKRGDVAYYIALSYQKTGSLSNAVTWAKRAASYKPGYGAPYQLIAGAFSSNANNCGSSQFEKLSAYWVAADYANKACAVDSRSCSWSRKAVASYESMAPSDELVFSQGKKAGQSVTVNCLGGATTRIR